MIQRCKPLLGTFVEIKIFSENSSAYIAADEAFDELQEIHDLMSFFDEGSEVYLLNQRAHLEPINVDYRLFEVLQIAQKISQISEGFFDITLHRSSGHTSSSSIRLTSNSSVYFEQKLQIDLGGIAKGYAVDRAALVLENNGVTDYLINAGGDLRVGKSAHKISIRNPQNPAAAICEAEICQGSLATSAGYFSHQEINGKKVYPIFQPHAGALESRGESVSVFAKDCVVADALTKVVAIKKEDSQKILSEFDATAALIFADGQISFLNQ